MRNRFATIAIPLATLAFVVTSGRIVGQLQAGAAQTPPASSERSVWDSVYSSSQADTGKLVYEESCAGCHGLDLDGGKARGLRGDAFLRDWGSDTLGRFYTRVKTLMPRGAPDSLTEEEYLAVVAYVLRVNEFPVGSQPLEVSKLDEVKIYGKGGPSSVPDFALIGVVGCLSQGADKSWTLTSASNPVMTRDPAASVEAGRAKAADQPLGTGTFLVLDAFPSPDAHNGHKVEAKGFLMRAKGAIGITSIQTVAATCEK